MMGREEGEDPTFFVNGQTVTFPKGKIIEDSTISIVGSSGYWVETAKDVMPVVSSRYDRYERFPSLKYTFNEYEDGAFDYNTSQPKNAWGFTWKKFGDIKGESKIVTIDYDKKLSIIGNSKNWLKSLPANITAGDTYAEDQAWEITITIPKGLSKDAEIQLLNYSGTKQEQEDGGFKIKDSQVYYATGKFDADDMPIYEELGQVDADTTYTFVRYMDFNDKDAFTSTFTLKNKNGRTLKSAENIPAPFFNTIETVGFAVAEADKAVLVDDFKFFLTGTTLDFSVYDAKVGYVADLDAVRDSSTAYRLSWLNATMEEETAYIKADITEGGKTTTTVVKEIKMMPGSDSIATGVVEIKEVRMSPSIDVNDFNVKQRNAQKFLADGNRCKVTVRFRGREMAHTDIGQDLLLKFAEGCADVAVMDKSPKLEGRHMSIFLSPKPAKDMKK
jgi:hypothetical protein